MLTEYTNQYITLAKQAGPMAALVMVAMGAVFLTHGWKIFKYMVTLDAAMVGYILGRALGEEMGKPHLGIIFAIGGALAFAALVWPMMKFSVGAIGTLFGAIVGYVIWGGIVQAAALPGMSNYAWIGGLLGALAMAALAMSLFNTAAVVVTSIQGSWLAVTGITALAMSIQGLDRQIEQRLMTDPLLLPAIMLCLTLIGIIVQQSRYLAVAQKKKKAAMAPK